MFLEQKININNIRHLVNAAEHLQDAGKIEQAKNVLHDLGENLIKLTKGK